jgi:hypothetical protein
MEKYGTTKVRSGFRYQSTQQNAKEERLQKLHR